MNVDFSFERMQKSVSKNLFKEIVDIEDIFSNQVQLLNEVAITQRNLTAFYLKYSWAGSQETPEEGQFRLQSIINRLTISNLAFIGTQSYRFLNQANTAEAVLKYIKEFVRYAHPYVSSIVKKFIREHSRKYKFPTTYEQVDVIKKQLPAIEYTDNGGMIFAKDRNKELYSDMLSIVDELLPQEKESRDYFKSIIPHFVVALLHHMFVDFVNESIKIISSFNEAQKYGFLRGVDIFRFKTLPQLNTALIEIRQKIEKKKEDNEYRRYIKNNNSVIKQFTIYEDNTALVIRPPSHIFSRIFFGAPYRRSVLDKQLKPGTKWCTSAANSRHFNDYVIRDKQNLIYIIYKGRDTLFALRTQPLGQMKEIAQANSVIDRMRNNIIRMQDKIKKDGSNKSLLTFYKNIWLIIDSLPIYEIRDSENHILNMPALISSVYGPITKDNYKQIANFILKCLLNEELGDTEEIAADSTSVESLIHQFNKSLRTII